MKFIYILIYNFSFITCLFAECNGFNWFHNIDIEHCEPNDINILKEFINNSENSLEMDMDVNYNGKIDVIELGWQLWENGRLIHWICQEVPSPYYFYEYDCGLSGKIPNEISNLDAIIKLQIQNNNLSGLIPPSICYLNNINSGEYWFNLQNNHFCPPYPDCLDSLSYIQNITNCK